MAWKFYKSYEIYILSKAVIDIRLCPGPSATFWWNEPKYITHRNAVRGGPSHGHMHKNLVKFGRTVFELRERTERQTDVLNVLYNPNKAK